MLSNRQQSSPVPVQLALFTASNIQRINNQTQPSELPLSRHIDLLHEKAPGEVFYKYKAERINSQYLHKSKSEHLLDRAVLLQHRRLQFALQAVSHQREKSQVQLRRQLSIYFKTMQADNPSLDRMEVLMDLLKDTEAKKFFQNQFHDKLAQARQLCQKYGGTQPTFYWKPKKPAIKPERTVSLPKKLEALSKIDHSNHARIIFQPKDLQAMQSLVDLGEEQQPQSSSNSMSMVEKVEKMIRTNKICERQRELKSLHHKKAKTFIPSVDPLALLEEWRHPPKPKQALRTYHSPNRKPKRKLAQSQSFGQMPSAELVKELHQISNLLDVGTNRTFLHNIIPTKSQFTRINL